MKPRQRKEFAADMSAARAAIRHGEYTLAMHHLERAHVLGQRHVVPHVSVHGWMFYVAAARCEVRAAFGQLVRIILGAVGSAIGVVPVGNTGGSDVNMFKPQTISADLLRIMERDHD